MTSAIPARMRWETVLPLITSDMLLRATPSSSASAVGVMHLHAQVRFDLFWVHF